MTEKEKKRKQKQCILDSIDYLVCLTLKKYHRAYDIGYSLILSLNTSNSPSAVLISVCFLLESKRNFSHFLFLSLKLWQTSKAAQENYEILNLHRKRQNERKKHPLFFFSSQRSRELKAPLT